MTEMFGEAWSPMSVPDLAPDDDDDDSTNKIIFLTKLHMKLTLVHLSVKICLVYHSRSLSRVSQMSVLKYSYLKLFPISMTFFLKIKLKGRYYSEILNYLQNF